MPHCFRATILCGVLLGLVFGPIPAGQAQTEFVTGFDALPLMDGLRNDPASVLVFDSADGRLVESRAFGAVDPLDVRDFYAKTLPQLGWNPTQSDRFEREGEILTLDYIGAPPNLTVQFTLSPGR